jgi:hypothetical protein
MRYLSRQWPRGRQRPSGASVNNRHQRHGVPTTPLAIVSSPLTGLSAFSSLLSACDDSSNAGNRSGVAVADSKSNASYRPPKMQSSDVRLLAKAV